MKIYGIGTDIVSVDRIKKSLKNKNFIKRLFNKDEVIKCSKLINSNNCLNCKYTNTSVKSMAPLQNSLNDIPIPANHSNNSSNSKNK